MIGSIVLILRIFLTISLYLFLGWILYILWHELKLHGTVLEARKVPPISLTIQIRKQELRVVHFHQPDFTIGRNAACECQINEESISSQHARLSFHHNNWWLEDLGSTNGTYLNNAALVTPTIVVSGDCFRCGESSLTVTQTNDIDTPVKG